MRLFHIGRILYLVSHSSRRRVKDTYVNSKVYLVGKENHLHISERWQEGRPQPEGQSQSTGDPY